MNAYKGYDLFTDFEDKALQTRNRAVILTNILQDNFRDGKVSPNGAGLVVGYTNAIPEAERKEVVQEFIKQANQRGFKIANAS